MSTPENEDVQHKWADYQNGNTLTCNAKNLKDENMPELAAFLENHPEITSVSLQNNEIGDKGAAILVGVNSILSLDLANNKINDKGTKEFRKALVNNETLKELILDGNDITYKTIKRLAEHKALSKLSLQSIGIWDKSTDALNRNKTLFEVHVDDLRISKEHLKILEQIGPRNMAAKKGLVNKKEKTPQQPSVCSFTRQLLMPPPKASKQEESKLSKKVSLSS